MIYKDNMFKWVMWTPGAYGFNAGEYKAIIEILNFSFPSIWRVSISLGGYGDKKEYEEEFVTLQEVKQFALDKIKYFTDLKIKELNKFNYWYDLNRTID